MPAGRPDGYGWGQRLPLGWRGLDPADHVHAPDHAAEGCKALPVGVALAAEVQLGLVADADEEVGGGRVGPVAGHGERAVTVTQPRSARPLEGDGGEVVLLAGGSDARLHHLDADGVARLVVGPDGAMEAAAVV